MGRIARNLGDRPRATDPATLPKSRALFQNPERKHSGSASKTPISLEQFSRLKNRCWIHKRTARGFLKDYITTLAIRKNVN